MLWNRYYFYFIVVKIASAKDNMNIFLQAEISRSRGGNLVAIGVGDSKKEQVIQCKNK